MTKSAASFRDRWDKDSAQQAWSAISSGAELDAVGLTKTSDGRWDLRGIPGPVVKATPTSVSADFLVEEYVGIDAFRGLELADLDFSYASIPHTRLFDCTVTNCRFDQADLSDLRTWRTRLNQCSFAGTRLDDWSVGGWDKEKQVGDSAVDCVFADTDLSSMGSLSGDFIRCSFLSVTMNENQFQGTIFEDCRFSGLYDSVRFDGRDRFATKYPGRRTLNTMHGCDFSGAELSGSEFLWIDTRNVRLPADPNILVIDDCAAVVERALAYVQSLPEGTAEAGIVAKQLTRFLGDVKPGGQNIRDLKVAADFGSKGARWNELTIEALTAGGWGGRRAG